MAFTIRQLQYFVAVAVCNSASRRWLRAMCFPICWRATDALIPAVDISAIEDNGDYLFKPSGARFLQAARADVGRCV
jgi:hypothetical protein